MAACGPRAAVGNAGDWVSRCYHSTERPERLSAFRRGLGEAGFTESQNVAIEYRFAEGHYDRFPELALDFVRHGVAVIAAPGNIPATRAAISATTSIPIVFAIPDDPVKLGLVASLNRPGGNATGINFFIDELVPKRLALLRELLPGLARVAVLSNPTEPSTGSLAENVEGAARRLGLQIQMIEASTSQQIDEALSRLAVTGPMRCLSGPMFSSIPAKFSSPFWRRATGCRPALACGIMSKLVA